MNKKLYIFMSVLAATAFTSAVKAERCCFPSLQIASVKPHFYLDAGLGHAFDSHVGSDSFTAVDRAQSITFSLSPANHPSPDNLLIGAGFLWPQPYQANSPYFPFLSLGLQYQYTNFGNTKTLMKLTLTAPAGETVSLNSPYVFSQNSLLANLKLDLYRWGRVMPYVNLGLGASWNQSKEKDLFLLPPENTDEIETPTARNTAFSYNVGAGLDFLVTERFWLSLGYNYNNFGQVQIGKIFNPEEPSIILPAASGFRSFNLSNLTTHNIQLTGRYVFG